MSRKSNGRRSAVRVAGWGLVVGLYVVVLMVAVQVTGGGTAVVESGGAVAMGGVVQAGVMDPGLASEAFRVGPNDRSESPIVTLAIAGVALGAAAVWRLSRRPRPRPAAVRAATTARQNRPLTTAT